MNNEIQFEGKFKTGLILTIVGTILFIGIVIMFASLMVAGIDALFYGSNDGNKTSFLAMVIFIVIISTIGSIILFGSIITLILSVIALKNKSTKNYILLALLSIIFGGILGVIGGILMFTSEKMLLDKVGKLEKNLNNQNLQDPQSLKDKSKMRVQVKDKINKIEANGEKK